MCAVTEIEGESRLLCDEMLMRLGRWLRAAGYDTGIAAKGSNDRALFEQARSEGRLLISRDRKFAEYRDAGRHVLVLNCNTLPECAAELKARLGIDWEHRPFSRCLVCNTPVKDAEECHRLMIPAQSLQFHDPLYYCPGCGRVYWGGSHVRRMRKRLAEWNGH